MLNIIVAIPGEAKPLIQHLRLQKQAYKHYDLYSAENLRLLICGVGKFAAASACGWLQGLNENPEIAITDAWLNIGIAGHGYQPLGSGHLVHRIHDKNSSHSWYPGFTFKRPCPSATLISVEHPESRYLENALYDMEGAGYFASCQRFSSVELIHCFKIVSDNHFSGIENINKAYVSELITGQIPIIEHIIDSLQQIQQQLASRQQAPAHYQHCLETWHFSYYQRKQLYQLLWRWQALSPVNLSLSTELDHMKNARQVLDYLQDSMAQQPTLIGT
jgi:hypothetical protein